MLSLAALLTVPLLFGTPIIAKGAPEPAAVIIGINHEGNGCPAGSVSAYIDQASGVLTTIFDKFVAADGPKAGGDKTRALCKVTIGIDCPGWSFDVENADFRGHVYLEKGVEASIVNRWKWIDSAGNDMKGKGSVQKKLKGPYDNDFHLHKDGELTDNEASACMKKDAKIRFTLSATVEAGNSGHNGYVNGDSLDTKFTQLWNLKWTKC